MKAVGNAMRCVRCDVVRCNATLAVREAFVSAVAIHDLPFFSSHK